MKSITVNNLDEFKSFVLNLKKNLSSKQLILLNGPLGSGKTQFVKCLVDGADDVTSPTFSIHNKYQLKNITIDHFDLYRLEGDEDLDSTGFWDIFNQSSGLVIVEWADRLPQEVYPLNWPQMLITIGLVEGEADQRIITVE